MSLNNRILLSSPCYGNVDPEILQDWMCFAYHCGRRMPEYEFFIGIKSKSEQFRARNTIVEGAQQHNCDRILMMDDDMVIDWEHKGSKSFEFLKKLIAHDKDICGVRYYQRGQECNPVLMAKMSEKGYRFLRDDEIEYRLQQVDIAGGGCLLIKTKVFDRITFPYFEPEHLYGTDLQLCRKAAEKGMTVWADTSIEMGHLRNEKTVVTSRNRHQFQEGVPTITDGKRTFVATDVYGRLMEDVLEYTGFKTPEEVWHLADAFHDLRKVSELSDADWYREHAIPRVCRQVWFNSLHDDKKKMTQFILAAIPHNRPLKILDFGCGIGITAFTLAEKGHQVTAMDVRGTGTLEFLKWRCKKHGVNIRFVESEGGAPKLSEVYDSIVAMDSIEHIEQWKETVAQLGTHLKQDGILFSNNGVLYDLEHQEHYPVHPKEFVKVCADVDLMPHTQISFVKREASVYA